MMVFFFSSRRRHTIWNCDWSSDVCSSDLGGRWPLAGRAGVRDNPPPVDRLRARNLARSLAAIALAALAAAGRAGAAEPIVLRFSHVVAVNTPKGQAADLFRRRAEELTGGRVHVEVFPNSTLYKDREEIEALQLGSVQMIAPSLSKFGPLGVTEFEVFDLPYLFSGYESLRRVTQGPVGRALLDKLEPKG